LNTQVLANVRPALPLWTLPLLPVAVYAVSYLYLAAYHGQPLLWHTVIHESGRLTFYETLFYSSHFLAHLPVHLVLALFFVGFFLGFAGPANTSHRDRRLLAAAIGVFLLASLAHALLTFGPQDTLDYLLQRKQGADRFDEGGSWKLHYASTMILPLLMPAYIWTARRLLGLPVHHERFSWRLIAGGSAGFLLFAAWFDADPLAAIGHAWSEPRYLGHAVREICTFTLTYFPLLLWLMARRERPAASPAPRHVRMPRAAVGAFIVFIMGFTYQAAVALRADIGRITQKPDFAVGGELSVPYLLASHYFEHALDSIFFALAGLLLFLSARRSGPAGAVMR
jgi:hypothetical protein